MRPLKSPLYLLVSIFDTNQSEGSHCVFLTSGTIFGVTSYLYITVCTASEARMRRGHREVITIGYKQRCQLNIACDVEQSMSDMKARLNEQRPWCRHACLEKYISRCKLVRSIEGLADFTLRVELDKRCGTMDLNVTATLMYLTVSLLNSYWCCARISIIDRARAREGYRRYCVSSSFGFTSAPSRLARTQEAPLQLRWHQCHNTRRLSSKLRKRISIHGLSGFTKKRCSPSAS